MTTPSTYFVSTNQPSVITPKGGVPPFSYTITSGSGSVDALTGIFTAPVLEGTSTLTISDAVFEYSYPTVQAIKFSWVGGLDSANLPTGGFASACTTTTSGFTPGWCTGGVADSAGGSDQITPQGLTVGPTGKNVYFVQSQNPDYKIYLLDTQLGTRGLFFDFVASGYSDHPLFLASDSDENIYVSTNKNRIFKIDSSGSVVGWIGRITAAIGAGYPSYCSTNTGVWPYTFNGGWLCSGTLNTGVLANTAATEGLMKNPQAIALDSTYLYVVDSSYYRINRYLLSTGETKGWIGYWYSGSTDSTCRTSAGNLVTSGWCQTSNNFPAIGTATDGGFDTPVGVAVDSSYLYVSDSGDHRILKFDKTTGVFEGWIGHTTSVLTSPRTQGTSCTGVSSGTNQYWCTGGTPSSGSGDFEFNSPNGIAVDSSGNLYVSDFSNNRISKISSPSGDTPTFVGAFGEINSGSPASGQGCSTLSLPATAPDWCTGGVSTLGSSDGNFKSPYDIAVDINGMVYVSDLGNFRVQRVAQ